jgi:hypothetical protein
MFSTYNNSPLRLRLGQNFVTRRHVDTCIRQACASIAQNAALHASFNEEHSI